MVWSWPRIAICSWSGTLDAAAIAPMFFMASAICGPVVLKTATVSARAPENIFAQLDIGHVFGQRLEDAVAGGECLDHLLDGGLGRLCRESGHCGERADSLIGEIGESGLHVVSGS